VHPVQNDAIADGQAKRVQVREHLKRSGLASLFHRGLTALVSATVEHAHPFRAERCPGLDFLAVFVLRGRGGLQGYELVAGTLLHATLGNLNGINSATTARGRPKSSSSSTSSAGLKNHSTSNSSAAATSSS